MTYDFVVAVNEYGEFAIPESAKHRPAAQMILAGSVYEPDTIQFMIDNCGDGAIVHAGTFFGDFLPALANNCNGPILAFEPVKENYECAYQTLELNFGESQGHNVRLYNYGLGEATEEKNIMIKGDTGEQLGGASRYVYNHNTVTAEQLEETQIVTIDEMVNKCGVAYDNVSIVQLDVEGYEEQALKGALKTIEESSPILILECWSPDVLETPFFKQEIFGKGYEYLRNLHDNVVLKKT